MKTVIKNVNVFDGENLLEPHDVFLNDEFITDSFDSSDAIKYGVTTMLDMATGSDELINSLRDKKGLTKIESCHQPVVSEAAEPLLRAMETSMAEHMRKNYVANISDVKTQIDRQIEKGADYIKVILGEPPLMKTEMTPEILREVVNYSHECGKMVHVHTTSVHTYELAVNAGVDVLHHLPQGEILPKTILEKMKAKNLTAVPTLLMDKGMAEAAKRLMPERGADYSFVKKNFESLHEAGVRIIAGTDANYTNKMNFVPHGESMHTELELMVDGGFSPVEALVSATSLAAKTFHPGKRGVIAQGYYSDLLLVKGNPLKNIKDIRKIQKVWVSGEEVKR